MKTDQITTDTVETDTVETDTVEVAKKNKSKFKAVARNRFYKGVAVRIELTPEKGKRTRTYQGSKIIEDRAFVDGDKNHLPMYQFGVEVVFDTQEELNEAKSKGLVQ